jgi:hypothetical protein
MTRISCRITWKGNNRCPRARRSRRRAPAWPVAHPTWRSRRPGWRPRVLVCRRRHNSSSLPMLPTIAFAVARAAASQAPDAAKTAGNAVTRLQAPEASAMHPLPEGDGTVSSTFTRRRVRLAPQPMAPVAHLLPSQLAIHLDRNNIRWPNDLWHEIGRKLVRRRWQHGSRGRSSRGRGSRGRSSRGCGRGRSRVSRDQSCSRGRGNRSRSQSRSSRGHRLSDRRRWSRVGIWIGATFPR